MVEHLPTVHKALGLISPQSLPTTTGGKGEREERGRREREERVLLEHGIAGL